MMAFSCIAEGRPTKREKERNLKYNRMKFLVAPRGNIGYKERRIIIAIQSVLEAFFNVLDYLIGFDIVQQCSTH